MEIIQATHPSLIWAIIGVLFLIAEFALPGLIAVFFGLAAWSMSIILLITPIDFTPQMFIFSGLSTLYLVTIRRKWKLHFNGLSRGVGDNIDETREEYIGKIVPVTEAIKNGLPGKIMFKGTNWEAIAEENIEVGTAVKILEISGIQFTVKPIKE